MKEYLFKKISEYWPPFLSGILLVFAFPSFDIFIFSWLAFIPLLVYLWDKDIKNSFKYGLVFGIIYFFGTLFWIYYSINNYGGLPFIASISIVLLLCLYLSLYPAVFASIYSLMLRKTRLPAMLVAPVIWTVLEFLRSYAFTGFPWSSIGYSQYKFLSLIQISDITGVYGISFLVLSFNGAISDIFLIKKRTHTMPLFPVSYTIFSFVILLLLFLFTFIYGFWRLGQERPGNTFKAGFVQGNIEQDRKWEPEFQKEVMETYFNLSRDLSLQSPDLIVWPETSIPFFYGNDISNTEAFTEFQRSLNANLLFGGVLVHKSDSERVNLSNSAILLDKAGKPVYKYDKIHLVPFGEYVPLKSLLFFVDKLVEGIGDYIPGKDYIRAGTPYGSFSTVICYEIIFPGLVRKFFVEGGDFLVNITNDAWFGKTSGPYQHFSMVVFRAIENRKPVIRAANTGISGIIDSYGRIIKTTSIFKKEYAVGLIKTDNTLTFYTKYGDIFSYLCIVISVILLMNHKIWR